MVINMELNITVNYLITLTCLAGAIFFIYLSWKTLTDKTKDNFHQDKEVNLFYLSSVGSFFVIAFILISVWLLATSEPNEVMCRYGNCSFGPYSWSLTVLSFSLALFFAVFFYTAIRRIVVKRKLH